MTPIPVGTLCLLIPPSTCAGYECTVVAPEALREVADDHGHITLERVYHIEFRHLAPPVGFDGYCAPRAHLLPLMPPSRNPAATTARKRPEAMFR